MIKLHKQLWYILGEGREGLAYMSHYEDNKAFDKRKATGINWAAKRYRTEVDENKEYGSVCDNTPISGFTISEVASRWSTQNKLFRIQDPRGFTVEVPSGNIPELLSHTTVINGVVQEECVWGKEGSNHILLSTNSPPYLEAVQDTKVMDERISYSKLDIGDIFYKSVDDTKLWIYLGKVKATWKCDTREATETRKDYWRGDNFIRNPSDQVISSKLVTDKRWVHLYKKVDRNGSVYDFDSCVSGKVCKTGKKSIDTSIEGVSVSMPYNQREESSWYMSPEGHYWGISEILLKRKGE